MIESHLVVVLLDNRQEVITEALEDHTHMSGPVPGPGEIRIGFRCNYQVWVVSCRSPSVVTNMLEPVQKLYDTGIEGTIPKPPLRHCRRHTLQQLDLVIRGFPKTRVELCQVWGKIRVKLCQV